MGNSRRNTGPFMNRDLYWLMVQPEKICFTDFFHSCYRYVTCSQFTWYNSEWVGRDSSVDIATRHGLDVPWIESRWGIGFPYLSGMTVEPNQPTMRWVTLLSSEVKRTGRSVDHTTPSIAEVKERVELCIYSPSGPPQPVLGWNFTL